MSNPIIRFLLKLRLTFGANWAQEYNQVSGFPNTFYCDFSGVLAFDVTSLVILKKILALSPSFQAKYTNGT